MGGALPIHITMFLYAIDELTTNTFDGLRKDCLDEKSYIFRMDDITYMKYSHGSCICLLLVQMLLDFSHRKNYFKTEFLLYIRQFLRLVNVCFYVSAVLYVQTKLYDNALGLDGDGEEVDDGIYDKFVKEKYFEKCLDPDTERDEKLPFKKAFADTYDMYRYRKTETTIFYFQLGSLIVYIVYCMLYKSVKKFQ